MDSREGPIACNCDEAARLHIAPLRRRAPKTLLWSAMSTVLLCVSLALIVLAPESTSGNPLPGISWWSALLILHGILWLATGIRFLWRTR